MVPEFRSRGLFIASRLAEYANKSSFSALKDPVSVGHVHQGRERRETAPPGF